MADANSKGRHWRFIDLTGQRFGMLTVIEYAGIPEGTIHGRWRCKCDCGKEKIILGPSLRTGMTKSCGRHSPRKKHGLSNTPAYRSWRAMVSRCTNQKTKDYKKYGAVGITVCQRWIDSFEDFLADMGPRPPGDYSIDRINGKGGYEPGNCRWATLVEQAENRYTTRWIEHDGERLSMTQWAARSGISVELLWYRLEHGWQFVDAITIRPNTRNRPLGCPASGTQEP